MAPTEATTWPPQVRICFVHLFFPNSTKSQIGSYHISATKDDVMSTQPRARGRPTHDELYTRLRVQIAELHKNLGGLPLPAEAEDIWRGIWYEEAHHSTAIEGNTLVPKQVEQLLAENRAVGNKDLRDYLEVKGYADAAAWVYNQAVRPIGLSQHGKILTLAEIREVHRAALSPVWEVSPHPDAEDREAPGHYRRHDIEPFPGGTTAVSWPLIDSELTAWTDDVNSLEDHSPKFPETLGMLHCRFEQIHPFLDGNGRTGRLVLNLILVRLGYPPVVIHKRNRNKYLRALRRADGGEAGPIGELVARTILESLYRFVLPAVAGPARLVPLETLASHDVKASALRAAASRGRLQASRGSDGRWRSSRQWVDDYLRSRYQRQ